MINLDELYDLNQSPARLIRYSAQNMLIRWVISIMLSETTKTAIT